MTYNDLDPDKIDQQRACLRDEAAFAAKHSNTSLPLQTEDALALALLLDALAHIGMNAPGGHQYLLEEASRWSRVLKGRD